MLAIGGKFLIGLLGIEAPDAGAAGERRTGIEAFGWLTLGDVRVRADIVLARHRYQEMAAIVEGHAHIVVTDGGKTVHDHVRLGAGDQFIALEHEAIDRAGRGHIKRALVKADAGAVIHRAEMLDAGRLVIASNVHRDHAGLSGGAAFFACGYI